MSDKALKIGLILSATDKMSRIVDQAVNKSTNRMNAFQKSISNTGSKFQKIGAVIAASGAALTTGLFVNVDNMAEKAKQIQFASERIGLSSSEYQKLSYAASKGLLDLTAFETSMARLYKNQVAAASGNKKLEASFKAAGVSVRTADGRLKTGSEIILELSDNFKKAPNGVAKTAIAMQLFGRSGKDIIPILNKGSEAIKEYGKDFEYFGNLLTDSQLKQFAQYRAAMSKNKLAMVGVKTILATTLIPIFIEYAQKMANIAKSIATWINNNKSLAQTIIMGAAGLGIFLSALGTFIVIFGTLMKSISVGIQIFSGLRYAVLFIQNAFLVANKSMLLFKIQYYSLIAVEKIATAVQWLWNAALAANPLVWIAVAIGAVIAVIVICWKKFAGFRAVILTVWETVKGFGNILKNFIIDRIKGIISGLGAMGSAIENLFKGNFSAALEDAKKGIRDLSGYDAVVNAYVGTKDLVSTIPQTYTQKLIQEQAKDNKSTSSTPVVSRSVQTVSNARTRNTSSQIVYSPNITVTGGTQADKQSFSKMLNDHKDDLAKMMNKINNNNSRLSFSQ